MREYFVNSSEITIADYLEFIHDTDRLPIDDLTPVLQGLFGEVGGLMTAVKKLKREPNSFTGFDSVIIEELGDAFWYLCCLSTRLDINIEEVFLKLAKESQKKPNIHLVSGNSPLAIIYHPDINDDFDAILVKLGQLTGNFLSSDFVRDNPSEKVYDFLKAYFSAISLLKINFSTVISDNIKKVSSRFIRPDNSDLPTFDDKFPEFERLPIEFEIEFVQRTKHHQAMRWNGVFIGDPLTDSIKDPDSYRFHDVFHFSYVAILHWSPTFRALIKHKRKSKPEIDRVQDGGRAIVVEEGLSAWIFNIAKENQFFEGRKSLTFDMLKNVAKTVKGFEVEDCPLILWEEAILSGYKVFREVVKNNGGIVIGNREKRTLKYREE